MRAERQARLSQNATTSRIDCIVFVGGGTADCVIFVREGDRTGLRTVEGTRNVADLGGGER